MTAERTNRRILVIDDEPQMLRALRSLLLQEGFEVLIAAHGREGVERAAEEQPDLVVLDMLLPDIDGTEVCRRIRAASQTPILVLSVRNSETDKVAALELGADDYVTKPFPTRELVARIRALLRRAIASPSATAINAGDLRIDLSRRVVSRGEEAIPLTRTEFDVLATLARNADRVTTTRSLMRAVWGDDSAQTLITLRATISRIRRKIARPGSEGGPILTEPGVGYRFVSG